MLTDDVPYNHSPIRILDRKQDRVCSWWNLLICSDIQNEDAGRRRKTSREESQLQGLRQCFCLYAPPFSILWYSQAIFILLRLFSHSICTSALIYISGTYLFLLGVVFRSIIENRRIKPVFSQTPYILLSRLLELATCYLVTHHTRPISRKIRGWKNSDIVWSYLIWS